MKLTRSREHVINMGQYESVRVGASVEISSDEVDAEVGRDNVTPEDLYAMAGEVLRDAMAADVKEAIDLLPSGSTSYIQVWGKTNA